MKHRSSNESDEGTSGISLTEGWLPHHWFLLTARPQGVKQKLRLRLNEWTISKLNRTKQTRILEQRPQAGWSESAKLPRSIKLLLGRTPTRQQNQDSLGGEKSVQFPKQSNRVWVPLQDLINKQEIEPSIR